MDIQSHLAKAPIVTFSSTASTFVIWGLHLSDLAAIVSACVALCGLGVQFWVARNKVRLMQSGQWKAGDE